MKQITLPEFKTAIKLVEWATTLEPGTDIVIARDGHIRHVFRVHEVDAHGCNNTYFDPEDGRMYHFSKLFHRPS